MKQFYLAIFISIITLCSSCKKDKVEFPVLKGPYFGQKLPGTKPAAIFAPGIISNGLVNRDVVITPNGKEMYFGIHTPDFKYSAILESHMEEGHWTRPEVASFSRDPRYIYLEPAISFDGKRMFFLSNMPKDSTENPAEEDIWVTDRTEDGWSKPVNLGEPVNTENREYYPSITKDGTLYFTRSEIGQRIHYIYRSRLVDGKYTLPEKLPEQVNCGLNRFNATIDKDERFIVVPVLGMEDSFGGVDYYIVFHNDDDTWEEPVNMGPSINSDAMAEWSMSFSPNGKYIFFMSSRTLPEENQPSQLNYDFFSKLMSIPQNGNADIYWINASVLDSLRR